VAVVKRCHNNHWRVASKHEGDESRQLRNNIGVFPLFASAKGREAVPHCEATSVFVSIETCMDCFKEVNLVDPRRIYRL